MINKYIVDSSSRILLKLYTFVLSIALIVSAPFCVCCVHVGHQPSLIAIGKETS